MKIHRTLSSVLCFLAFSALSALQPFSSSALSSPPAFRDATLPPEQRIDDLLSRLTLEEKTALCHSLDRPGDTFISGGVARLGIPQLHFSDGPVGVRSKDPKTALPSTISLSCTWDRGASRAYGQVLAAEMQASGLQVLFGPGVNMMRDPRGGRNYEYMGEDPFLTGSLAVEYIKTLQAGRVAACAKHLVANDHDRQRHMSSSNLSERTLREIYFRPFEMAVRDAGVWSIMTGNNLVNGVQMAENRDILQTLLKDRIGFDGVVVTDWRGAYDTKASALAGQDMTTGVCAYVYGNGNLLRAVRDGSVPEPVLNDKVRRILRLYLRTGLLDSTPPAKPSMNLVEHNRIACALAAEGMVLLKNDRDMLPLDKNKIKLLAITGPGAEYIAFGRGSGQVNTNTKITPLDGMRRFINDKSKLFHFAWSGALSSARAKQAKKQNTQSPAMPEMTDAAKAKLAAADAIVFFAIDEQHGEGDDLNNINLPWKQADAIRDLAAINPNVIVVLQIAQPVTLDGFSGKVPSMLVAWYAGQAAGDAIADVIFGETNPSGKLSSTFARSMKDYPCEALKTWPAKPVANIQRVNMSPNPESRKSTHGTDANYDEGVFIGYRWFDKHEIAPLYPFGHGLSYTTFAVSGCKLEEGGNAPRISCVVKNTGKRAGAEVVQVYVSPPKTAGIERPVRELKGFARAALQPGETKRVEITLPPDALCRYDEKKLAWAVDAGEYNLEIGTSSRDIKARLPLQITSPSTL